MRPSLRRLAIGAALLIASATPALAAPISIQVLLDTSAVVGNFTLDFQLNDGGVGPSTALSLSGFDFGGGASLDNETYAGGGSGTFDTGLSLTDSTFFNQVLGDFTAGSYLSFLITGDGAAQDPPDLFTMAIRDSEGNEIATAGFANEFLSITFNGEPLTETFGSTDENFPIGAPQAEALADVPEPSALLLVGSGVVGLAIGARRRRRQSAS